MANESKKDFKDLPQNGQAQKGTKSKPSLTASKSEPKRLSCCARFQKAQSFPLMYSLLFCRSML